VSGGGWTLPSGASLLTKAGGVGPWRRDDALEATKPRNAWHRQLRGSRRDGLVHPAIPNRVTSLHGNRRRSASYTTRSEQVSSPAGQVLGCQDLLLVLV